jgi:hypothetical protein
MNRKIPRAAWVILALYLTATALLLLIGYGAQKPAVQMREFPFSITYTYKGEQQTISGMFVAEFSPSARYLGDSPLGWFGYIQDHDMLSPDYIHIGEDETHTLSINLNLEPGWLMGDRNYAGSICAPTGLAIRLADGHRITEPEELEALGFRLEGWEYPQPIENRFFFGGFSLSSEAVLYTSAIALVSLLLCLAFVEKDLAQPGSRMNRIGIVLNLLVAVAAFPFILIVSTFSEILGDTSALQQLLYLTPALTLVGVGASVVLRRRGYALPGLLIQFIGPAVFALAVLIGEY